MKHSLSSLLVTGLLSLPLAAAAGSDEFFTPVPSTIAVAGYLDFDGAEPDKGQVSLTNLAVPPDSDHGAEWAGWAGQFKGYFSTVANDVLEDKNSDNLFFRFFCIDLYQQTPDTNSVPAAYSASQYSNSNMQKLYDVAYPNKQLGDFFSDGLTGFGQFVGDAARAYSAAFQLSVWELLYETGSTHSLNSGSFTNKESDPWYWDFLAASDAQAHNLANQWLSQVDGYTGAGYQNWQLYGFASPKQQDFMSATYSVAVPEPGSLLLAGLGLAGLALTNRRRRSCKV